MSGLSFGNMVILFVFTCSVCHLIILRRHNSRRANTVSYKEDSDEKTDSDDVLEVDNGETQDATTEPEMQTETIEKVIAQRRGKIGGKLEDISTELQVIFERYLLFSA